MIKCFKVSKFQSFRGNPNRVEGPCFNNGGRRTPLVSMGMVIMLVISFIQTVQGQPQKPPSPIKVTTYQNLSFGTIILPPSGGTGTVTISASGGRSSGGNVVLPLTGTQGAEAIFDVNAPPGTLITILFGSSSLSNGGHTMELTLGPTFPVIPFVTSKQKIDPTMVHVGGTLVVKDEILNPAGTYSGTFTVTFIQQ